MLDLAVEYAKSRVQFGRYIGSFQAIKHKCANMLLDVESAKAAAYYAAWVAAEGDEELPIAANMAKTYCSEAYSYAGRARAFKCMAVSGLPGPTPPICTSAGPRAARSCSAIRPITASCWPSALGV